MRDELIKLAEVLKEAKSEIGKVIIGQEEIIDKALITILCGQHALIEGVPGIAKTLMVRTISKIFSSSFKRIQFTPDLMPTDITGTNVFNLKDNQFTLVKGPIFTTFLLADEINRAPAKTQSALLQAMQEKKVTIDNETYLLSDNFSVFATQNPIEYEGTYPLPEAQKDRFMFKIFMDYPNREQEMELSHKMILDETPEKVLKSEILTPIITGEELLELRTYLKYILIKDEIVAYLVDLIRKTRNHRSILVGAGPRATQAMITGIRGLAILENRDFVTPDDIKEIAHSVLTHRLILRPEYEIEGLTIKEVIDEILKEVTVPK